MCKRPSKTTKSFLFERTNAVEKAKATLAVSSGRIEAAIQPKEVSLQKAKDLLVAAHEKLVLLRAEEAEKSAGCSRTHMKL